MIFHLPTQYSDSPISVNTNPTTDTTMTMLPIIRFSIQMPRKLNCVRTLLTKKVGWTVPDCCGTYKRQTPTEECFRKVAGKRCSC